ncbi:MAG: DEAD/DEAH box helicase family protein [Chloroflexaceae bacterium]|nr:DEAD/DEAH box helicase family protein [Chloroflexaceae bacterium]
MMDKICVSLDIESTGLQSGVDEIIEVAAVKFRGSEVLDTFTQLVRPRHSVPLKVLRLTGINPDELQIAPRFNQIGREFAAFLGKHPLIGHSVSFDLTMLRAQGMHFSQPVYDTFEMATMLLPQVSAYRLSALAEHFRIDHPADHRALNDADVTRQVFLYLVRKLETMGLRELMEVNRLMEQTDWSSRDLVADILRSKASSAWNVERNALIGDSLKLRPADENGGQLKPTGDASPVSDATIAAMFAEGGPLSRSFTTYEQRPQQVQMAQAVREAFNNSDALLVEAGTGTGKSMAYLLPAAIYALRRGERVVISTNTINLQDQLFNKDIPDVQRMLAESPDLLGNGEHTFAAESLELRAQLLKGRSNYLCLRRFKGVLREDKLEPHEARALLKARLWLGSTTTGDRAELLLMEDEQRAWERINVTVDTCTGHRCPDFRDCFFFRARRQAETAHVVVVNHALLLADLAAQANIIPQYDHLIVDEAHNLEDVATDQLGFRIDQSTLLKFLNDIFVEQDQLPSGLLSEYQLSFRESAADPAERERADQLAADLRPLVEQARRATYDGFNQLMVFVAHEQNGAAGNDNRLRLTPAVRGKEEWAAIEGAWENVSLALREIGDRLGKFESLLLELEGADLLNYDELMLRVQWLKRFATDVRVQIGHIIFGDEATICWLTHDPVRATVALNAAPLSVADILQGQLFAEKQTSILTSATLSVSESFEYVKERLGLHEPEELRLDSPFDYEQQALVYIPSDIPEPSQRGYQQMVEDALIKLCTATGGRTLALFTANSALRQTYVGIQDALEAHEISVLGQGIDGSRRALLERFKEEPRTVLLGTTSFWEGVDVVGDALSVLVIVKLPFSVPTDPVFAARSEQFKDAFGEFSVPQSILRFKQGFGRLIRSRSDRGIVVVLDKRLTSKKYGQQFLQSLPPTTVRTGTLKQLPGLAARFLKVEQQ